LKDQTMEWGYTQYNNEIKNTFKQKNHSIEWFFF
jgi:hypothetical protein